jgi:hypothetical protein
MNTEEIKKLAKDYSSGKSSAQVFKEAHEVDFIAGFNKCLGLNATKPFTPEITAQEESDSELNEAVSIIETLMQYGNIRPIEGVVYPAGTHKEFLHKANEWLHRNRSKVLTILKGM